MKGFDWEVLEALDSVDGGRAVDATGYEIAKELPRPRRGPGRRKIAALLEERSGGEHKPTLNSVIARALQALREKERLF